jgi:hypothetical protein
MLPNKTRTVEVKIISFLIYSPILFKNSKIWATFNNYETEHPGQFVSVPPVP